MLDKLMIMHLRLSMCLLKAVCHKCGSKRVHLCTCIGQQNNLIPLPVDQDLLVMCSVFFQKSVFALNGINFTLNTFAFTLLRPFSTFIDTLFIGCYNKVYTSCCV